VPDAFHPPGPMSSAVATSHIDGNFKDVRPAHCRRPAPPWLLHVCRLDPDGLNGRRSSTTISAARLSQSRSAAGLSRRRATTGLSRSGIWRARRSAATPTRGGPARAWRRGGLATRILELEQTRLGVGVWPLCLPPLPARELGSRSLDPTTRRMGLGAGTLAMTLTDC
jgi:hypothetical protein